VPFSQGDEVHLVSRSNVAGLIETTGILSRTVSKLNLSVIAFLYDVKTSNLYSARSRCANPSAFADVLGKALNLPRCSRPRLLIRFR
jgi:hypothetical protein